MEEGKNLAKRAKLFVQGYGHNGARPANSGFVRSLVKAGLVLGTITVLFTPLLIALSFLSGFVLLAGVFVGPLVVSYYGWEETVNFMRQWLRAIQQKLQNYWSPEAEKAPQSVDKKNSQKSNLPNDSKNAWTDKPALVAAQEDTAREPSSGVKEPEVLHSLFSGSPTQEREREISADDEQFVNKSSPIELTAASAIPNLNSDKIFPKLQDTFKKQVDAFSTSPQHSAIEE